MLAFLGHVLVIHLFWALVVGIGLWRAVVSETEPPHEPWQRSFEARLSERYRAHFREN